VTRSAELREAAWARIEPLIPQAEGRSVTYDRNAYRGRNVIERVFNGLKHWRGLATRCDKHATVYRGALVLAAALLWINDLGGVVASVLGVVHAFGELRPALVRRGDELHENGGALGDVRAGLAERVKNFSFRVCIHRPTGDPLRPPVPPYAARRRFARSCPSTADEKGKREYPLLSTLNV